jgi:succinate semialdehyde reductase (NADPH)
LMKAAVLSHTGQMPWIESIRTPEPKRREVLVRVAACGVCHTDLHVIKGEVAFPTPAVLGHEISGTVAVLGLDVPERLGLQVGSRVVGAFVMPCGECPACVRGRDDLCVPFFAKNRLNGTLFDDQTRLFTQDGEAVAMYSMGGLAQYAVVPADALTVLPPGLPLEESAVLGCAALTAYGAVRRAAEIQVGESVAVVAMGGVGSNVVQICRAFGAGRIIAIDISDKKLRSAAALGASDVVDASTGDPVEAVMALTGGQGVDVAFEVLGRPETFQQASRMLRDGGRLVAIGIGDGAATAGVEITRLVRRSQRIIGSYGARTRTDLPQIVSLAAGGLLHPQDTVSARYSLDEVADAYKAIQSGEIDGRAIIVM